MELVIRLAALQSEKVFWESFIVINSPLWILIHIYVITMALSIEIYINMYAETINHLHNYL